MLCLNILFSLTVRLEVAGTRYGVHESDVELTLLSLWVAAYSLVIWVPQLSGPDFVLFSKVAKFVVCRNKLVSYDSLLLVNAALA